MDELLANLSTDQHPLFDNPSVSTTFPELDTNFIQGIENASNLNSASLLPSDPSNPQPVSQSPAPSGLDFLDPNIADMTQLASSAGMSTAPFAMPLESPKLDVTPTHPDVPNVSRASVSASRVANSTPTLPMPTDSQHPHLNLPTPTGSHPPIGVFSAPSDLQVTPSLLDPTSSLPSAEPQNPGSAPITISPALPTPSPPVDTARRRYRATADAIVTASWKAARSPAAFVSAVRDELPAEDADDASPTPKQEDLIFSMQPDQNSRKRSLENAGGLPDAKRKKESGTPKKRDRAFRGWSLSKGAEGAILDALFTRLCSSNASSARLMTYLNHLLLAGLVSSRNVLSTCLSCVASTPDISDRALQSIARLLCQMLPYYSFTTFNDELTSEATDYLTAFTLTLRCAARMSSFAQEVSKMLAMDRVIALVRACARRVPECWDNINNAINDLEPRTAENSSPQAIGNWGSPSAFTVAPELKSYIKKLRSGLAHGITRIGAIAKSAEIQVPQEVQDLTNALQFALVVSGNVFGPKVARALKDLLTHRERRGGDVQLLLQLEIQANEPGGPLASKLSLKDKVRAAESIVRFLAESSSRLNGNTQWLSLWGGKERLNRIIRDAIPQVKTEIRSEIGCLIVSFAVISCAAMCLGSALRLDDPNDGIAIGDEAKVNERIAKDEEIEDTMSELSGFAVGCMEDAATAEEIPSWRSFGLWLLLLASRCGAMLRSSGCEEARAAMVLRAWGGMPTGTPGSHAGSSSGHRQSQSTGGGHATGHGTSSSSSTSASSAEGIAMFATPAAHAIIDVADVSGSDSTLHALCCDYIQ